MRMLTHKKPAQKTSIKPILCRFRSRRLTTKGMGRRNIIKSVMTWAIEFPILTGKLRHFPSIVLSQTAARGMQSMKDVTMTHMLLRATITRTTLLPMRAQPTKRNRR